MAAAIDGGARLDANEAVATLVLVVLHHLEPADHARAVQMQVVVAQFLHEITLLGDEIAGQQQLARPIRIALEGPEVAGGTQHLRGGVLMVGHSWFPSSAQLRRGSDAAFLVERDRRPAGELRRACQHRGPAERALAEGHTLRHAADH